MNPESCPQGFFALVQAIHARTDLDLVRTPDSAFVTAIDEARAQGVVPRPDSFPNVWRSVAGFHYGALEVPFTKRWNQLGPDVAIDLDAVVEARRSVYRSELEALRAEVLRADLSDVFREEWFSRINRVLDAWNGEGILSSPHCVTFFRALNRRIDGRSLAAEVRRIKDLLDSSPKKQFVRQRIGALAAKDAENTVGALFEMSVLSPMFEGGCTLEEFQPRIPSSGSRAEARVQIAGESVYVEATAFTRYDESTLEARAFDFAEEQRRGTARVAAKVIEKAEQLVGADLPVVLFLALTLGIDMEIAEAGLAQAFASRVDGLSAVVVTPDIDAVNVRLYEVPNARLPLAASTISSIQECFDNRR